MMAIRSPSLNASSRSWLTNRIVRRVSRCRSFSSSCSRPRISGSSAEKGSSIRRIGAPVTKARASPTRCCIPPESSATRASARSERPTSSSCSATRPARSALGAPASSSPSPTFCATVRQGRRPNCWNTMEAPRWRRRRSSRRPAWVTSRISPSIATRTRPRHTGASPLTARRSVDLPEPDSPISTTISPRRTSREASWTPSTWPVAAMISSRLAPASIIGSAVCGFGPKTMETSSKAIIVSVAASSCASRARTRAARRCPPICPLTASRRAGAPGACGRARWPAPRSPARSRSRARC